MAIPVYSSRLFAAQNLSPATGTVATTVPAGRTYVLRDIEAWESTGAAGAYFYVYSGFGMIMLVIQSGALFVKQQAEWRGRQVYASGERIAFLVGLGTWNISACGYNLFN